METNSNLSILEKIQEWISKSTSLKLLTIAFIALILLIPQSLTMDLIQERQMRLEEAEQEITQKWSREQTIIGPYLAVPFQTFREIQTNGETKLVKEINTAYFLPENLWINGNLQAQSLHRGVFDVVVYTGDFDFKAEFDTIPLGKLELTDDQMLWEQASIFLAVSDLRGIGENPELRFNDTLVSSEPFSDPQADLKGLEAPLPQLDSPAAFAFSGKLKLKGSKNFRISPLGKVTKLNLAGNWPNPSFQGEFLPETRNLEKDGFESSWQVLHFNRPFGQEYLGTLPDFHGSAFGLDLKLPVDQYQQSIRSSKYAILVIGLSFLSLFLMEIFTKKRIHPLQYSLIGFALVLYYTLLIALSEQLGFQLAYLLSSFATVGLLAFYSRTLFKKTKTTLLFTGILAVFYGFIYVIINQQDYALLIGSLGLFVALAITMFISNKIDWYKK